MKEINFSTFFHKSSKKHTDYPSDPKKWPDNWKTVFYKSYPRLDKIELLNDKLSSGNLFDLIEARRSRRNFNGESITIREISSLLKRSCGTTRSILLDNINRRAYPSGGGLYPIEIYTLIFRDNGELKSGVYHYNVKENSFDVLSVRAFTENDMDQLFTYDWVKKAPLVIIMTAVFGRTQSKYGERGYRLVLQESGHIGQNVYLISEALGLKCCALSGTHDENLEKLLDIDGISESVVYTLVIGK